MDAFYSIIYYKSNPLTDELISVGLLAGGGEGPFLYLSDERMKLLRKIVQPTNYTAIKRHLKGLKDKVDANRKEAAGVLLFDPVFSAEKLKEVANLVNGSLLFSQPTIINEWLNEAFFDSLIFSFLGEEK